jgi:putative phage-type endonuclease
MNIMHPNVEALIKREYAAQKSKEWLALRGQMLTASDAATAIGKNKYQTPHELLLKKCGLGEKFTGNDATRHGEKYEDEARMLYEERHGEIVHEIGLVPHPEHNWLGGSPDGVSESGKLVEIKCPPQRKIIPGEVPEHYMPQLQLCMEILDLESADFIQYKPAETNWPRPEEFDVVNVKRDREWWKTYLPVMREFWDKVLYYREHIDELPVTKTKEKRPRKKKDEKPVVCEIVEMSEDEYLSD